MSAMTNFSSEAAARSYLAMSDHGEAVRGATPDGILVLSHLQAGVSRIVSAAPSVRFVLTGEECYKIDGRMRRVRPGEFLLVESGVESVVRTSHDCIGMCIYLPGGSNAPEQDQLAFPAVTGSALDPFAQELRRQAAALIEDGSEIDTDAMISRATAEAQQFAARMTHTGGRLSQVRPAARMEILQRLERVKALLHEKADVAVSLDDLASEAALSRFHLVRSFAQAYGVPPLSYHRHLRLDAAAERLRRGEATPSQLSDELGYATHSAFTRAFRTRFGVPPIAFARRRAA